MLRPSVRLGANGPGSTITLAIVVVIGALIAGAATTVSPRMGQRVPGGGAAAAVAASTPVAGQTVIPDVPWLAQTGDGRWVYGHGDRGAVRRLPDHETGLAIGGSFVVSVLPAPGGRSIIRFRDRDSGRAVRDVAAAMWVSAGAWTGAGLVATGYGDATMATDGGLVLVSPDTGATSTLVDAGPFPTRLGRPVARGEVLVSPSGATVASNACGVELCDLQAVDLRTGLVTRPIHEAQGFLRSVTDDAVVTTDDASAWISARRISDGGQVWRQPDRALIDPVSLADGLLVGLVGSARAGWAVAAIDDAGRIRDLTPRSRADQALPRVWRAVSSRDVVVVSGTPFEDALSAGRSVSVTVLRATDGHAVKVAVALPAPAEAVR